MGRPGYMSLYADERTQAIFDEFCKIKGITKTKALEDMLVLYMICMDEDLYNQLYRKTKGVEVARELILQRSDSREVNDFLFMKLGTAYDTEYNPMDAYETIEAYIRNCEENTAGYTWFSTEALHFGMAKKKVEFYNSLCEIGEIVKILFAVGEDVNDIVYSARVLQIVSGRDPVERPDDVAFVPEEFSDEIKAKIWIKITDIKEENNIKASMLNVRSTESNLKQVISNSQFHFGYVYLKDN